MHKLIKTISLLLLIIQFSCVSSNKLTQKRQIEIDNAIINTSINDLIKHRQFYLDTTKWDISIPDGIFMSKEIGGIDTNTPNIDFNKVYSEENSKYYKAQTSVNNNLLNWNTIKVNNPEIKYLRKDTKLKEFDFVVTFKKPFYTKDREYAFVIFYGKDVDEFGK